MTDVNRARDKIDDILSDHEYQVYYEDNRNFLQKWWDSIVERFMEFIDNLFQSLNPSNGLATSIVAIISIVVAILVVLAIILVVRNYKRSHQFQDSKLLYNRKEMDWTYQDHLREADKEEIAGNLPSASRHLFLALLVYFHEKGYVERRIWKTNWEYVQELKLGQKERAESFYQIAKTFDDVVYGEQVVESESYVSYKEAVMHWIQEPQETTNRLEG